MRSFCHVAKYVLHRRVWRVVVLGLVFSVLNACGGEGIKAPYTPHGNEEGQCPSLSALTERTKQALDDDALINIAPVVNQILVDDGGLRGLFPVGRGLLRQVPPSELLSVTHDFEEGRGLARMSPHLVQVLAYMDGRSAFISGEHYGALDATYEILSDCAPLAILGATRRTLELEETLASGEVVPWIEAAFEALIDVADDPFFRDLLTRVEFDGEDQGGILVGKEAFTLLARLVATNIGAENFDLAYVRDLVDTALASQLGDESARQKLSHLLDLLERLVDEEEDVFPYVQAFMSCVADVDEAGGVPEILYDYLAIRELDFVEFLQDLNQMGTETAGTNLRITLIDAFTVLEETPRLTQDAIYILSRFISPENSRDTVPALHDLKGLGVATELILFLRSITRGCEG